jgi:hypothetical protein
MKSLRKKTELIPEEKKSIAEQLSAAEVVLEQAIDLIGDNEWVAESELSDMRFLIRDYLGSVRKWYIDENFANDDVVSMLGLRDDYDLEELSNNNIFY